MRDAQRAGRGWGFCGCSSVGAAEGCPGSRRGLFSAVPAGLVVCCPNWIQRMPRVSNCPFIQQPPLPCHGPLLLVIPSVPGFPTSPISQATTYVVLPKENHISSTEAATLNRKSGGGERICSAPFVCPAPSGSHPPLVIHRTAERQTRRASPRGGPSLMRLKSYWLIGVAAAVPEAVSAVSFSAK